MKIDKIKIYRATKKDIPFIVECDKEILDYHHSFDKRHKRSNGLSSKFKKFVSADIKKHDTYYFILNCNKANVGFLSFNIRKSIPILVIDKVAYLDTMYIQKKFRGLGLGKLAFDHLVNFLKKKKIKKLELTVNTKNKLGVGVWTSFGFKETSKKMEVNIK